MPLSALFASSTPITLDAMLAARERRAARQRELIAQFKTTLISFTLNIPGAYKAYPLARQAFDEGMDIVERQLARAKFPVPHREIDIADTGFEARLAGAAPAAEVKNIAMLVENGHGLGRLYDIDVLDSDGAALRGSDAGRPERQCLVCGKPVWECARSRAHSAEELAWRTARLIKDHFDAEFADRVASMATRALLYEVSATPKPGLVDRANNGSHADMDNFTFIDSSVVLTPYFRDLTRQGLAYAGEACRMLPWLRHPGQMAEDRMFAATGGVNTHKGLIFSMGILCAAMGMVRARQLPLTADTLLDLCGQIAANTPDELRRDHGADDTTHGEKVFGKYGLTGIRGEAAAGYPHVRRHGYPALRRAAMRGCHLNDAGVIALLHLLAHVPDTNMISRTDLDTLRSVQEEVRLFLEKDGEPAELLAFARELDARFIRRRLSPGGCADLLAVAYFLYFAMDERICNSTKKQQEKTPHHRHPGGEAHAAPRTI